MNEQERDPVGLERALVDMAWLDRADVPVLRRRVLDARLGWPASLADLHGSGCPAQRHADAESELASHVDSDCHPNTATQQYARQNQHICPD